MLSFLNIGVFVSLAIATDAFVVASVETVTGLEGSKEWWFNLCHFLLWEGQSGAVGVEMGIESSLLLY